MLQYTRNQRTPMLEYEDSDCVKGKWVQTISVFIIEECLLCDSIDNFLTEKMYICRFRKIILSTL